jgi:formylmethanofuran dehydrogenase subunit A
MKKTWIKNGTVYDPRNGINGEKMDIFIDNGKIVDVPKSIPGPEEIIDASGKTVMPGGIDVHSHVATYGLNLARFTLDFPTVNEIGYAYAKMGYTHVNEPLMTLNTASYVHHELSSIPFVDTSAFIVVNLADMANQIRRKEKEEAKNSLLLLIALTRAIGVEIYDVGVRYAKKGYFYRDIDTKKCLNFMYQVSQLKSEPAEKGEELPRIHLRTYPGLLDEDVDVLSAFSLAHIAFGIDNEERYAAAKEVVKKGGFADLGIFNPEYTNMQIGYDVPVFASTSTSAPAEYGNKFLSMDIGLEKPLILSKHDERGDGDVQSKCIYYSLKFALESVEYLDLDRDSCCISFSTDSPNGGFLHYYPPIFSLLLSSRSRKEIDGLPDVDTEFSLYQLAAITRMNPARLLGLKNKGHLGIGADADIAIYDLNLDIDTDSREVAKKLGNCEYLLKGGNEVIYEGNMNLKEEVEKKTFYLKIKKEGEYEKMERIRRELCDKRTFRMEHLRVADCFLGEFESV